MNPNSYLCNHCNKPMAIDPQTPMEVIVENFLVVELYRELEPRTPIELVLAQLNDNVYVEHPLVCSDTCYGALLRAKPEGWEITPAEELQQRTNP